VASVVGGQDHLRDDQPRHALAPVVLVIGMAFFAMPQLVAAQTPSRALGVVLCAIGLVIAGMTWERWRRGGSKDLSVSLDTLETPPPTRPKFARGHCVKRRGARAEAPAMVVTHVADRLEWVQRITVDPNDGRDIVESYRSDELERVALGPKGGLW
jgi:hypothetical protein